MCPVMTRMLISNPEYVENLTSEREHANQRYVCDPVCSRVNFLPKVLATSRSCCM